MIRAWLLLVTALMGTVAPAADWPRFRGPNGAGVGGSAVPLEWSAEKNLRWLEVVETRAHLENGGIAHWQVTVKIGATLEP